MDEYGNRFELCVSKNAIAGHLGHGDFLGPCISCGGAKAINPNGNVLEELHVELFPVPANDVLTVDINSATYSNATISITDNLGRLVYRFDTDLASGSNVMEIDVSNYTSGVYMLKVESENSIESVKMIVQ